MDVRSNIISKASDPVPVKNRTLFFGDNLKILREKFPSDEGYFDLIYLDPPFNSQANYNILFREGLVDSPAQVHAFEDTWHWTPETQAQFTELASHPRYTQKIAEVMQGLEKVIGHNDVLAYLTMMAVRLVELHRVLKENGSLYLHCDPSASHYLKVVLDAVFGPKYFRNEVVWKRSSAHSSSKRYSPVHDTILFYAKSDAYTWNNIYTPLPQETADAWYNNVEAETGRRFNRADLTAAGTRTGPSGLPWRGIDPTSKGRHWAIPGFVKEVVAGLETQAALDALDAAGRIFWPKAAGGIPMLKRYLEEAKGIPPLDTITDISPLNNVAAERLGYPTQKPQALLERIITCSSNKGDWVLDPFGGCGTTVAAAEALDRNWVIVDITTLSINLVKRRIEKAYPDKALDMTVDGYPADLAGAKELFDQDPFQFEYWCCDLVNAQPAGDKRQGKMKGADRGIDGIITIVEPATGGGVQYRKVIVQVKGGHISSPHLRDFRGTIEREKALGGVFITMESPTRPMVQEATEAGAFTYSMNNQKYPVIQIITVAELLDGKRPNLPNVLAYAKQAQLATAVPEQGSLLGGGASVRAPKRRPR
jgi:DNA modification methylase